MKYYMSCGRARRERNALAAPVLMCATLVAALSACGPPTEPHDQSGGPVIAGALEISAPATRDTLLAHYKDVSQCAGWPFDPNKFKLARFYEAAHIELDGVSLVGLRMGLYLYSVMGSHRPTFWRSMRHEILHYVTELKHDGGFEEFESCI